MILTCPNCSSKFKVPDNALGTEGRKVKCSKCEHRWHAMPEAAAAPAPVAPAAPAPAAPAAPAAAAEAPAPAPPVEEAAPPPPPPPPPPPAAEEGGAEAEAAPPPPPPPALDDDDDEAPPPPPPDPEAVGDVVDAVTEALAESIGEDALPEMSGEPPIPAAPGASPAAAPKKKSKLWLHLVIGLVVFIVAVATAGVFMRQTLVHYFPPANMLFMMVGLPADTLGYGLNILTPKTSQKLDDKDRVLEIKGEIENTTGKVADLPMLKATLRNSKGDDLLSWTFKAKDPRVLPGEKVGYRTEYRNPPRGSTGLNITFTRPGEMSEKGDKGDKGDKMDTKDKKEK